MVNLESSQEFDNRFSTTCFSNSSLISNNNIFSSNIIQNSFTIHLKNLEIYFLVEMMYQEHRELCLINITNVKMSSGKVILVKYDDNTNILLVYYLFDKKWTQLGLFRF